MKIINFKVAKAIKEAGYPQENCTHYIDNYAAPSYLEVWTWLAVKKGIYINCERKRTLDGDYPSKDLYVTVIFDEFLDKKNVGIQHMMPLSDSINPEESIAAAIDNLVENNLIYGKENLYSTE